MELSRRVKRMVAPIVLTIFILYAIIYLNHFRYREISKVLLPDKTIVTLIVDNLISGHMKYSTCGCFDESYYLVKVNDNVVYKFYRDVSELPDYFDIVNIQEDSISIEACRCFIFKIPYKLKNITRSNIRFINKDCHKDNFLYYQSPEFIKDYELKYFFFPVVK